MEALIIGKVVKVGHEDVEIREDLVHEGTRACGHLGGRKGEGLLKQSLVMMIEICGS